MPKKIIIVRHGQTAHNKNKILQGHLDTSLDEIGVSQAHEAAVMLKNEFFEVVFSSDLRRSAQTAEIATKHHEIPAILTPLLREKYFGKMQGMSIAKIRANFGLDKFGEQGNYSFAGREEELGIEKEEAIIKRIIEFKKLLTPYQGKTVILFSHGGLIRHMLRMFGIPKEVTKTMHIKNAAPLVLIKKGETYILES